MQISVLCMVYAFVCMYVYVYVALIIVCVYVYVYVCAVEPMDECHAKHYCLCAVYGTSTHTHTRTHHTLYCTNT